MANYYCEYCGHRFADVRQLVSATCSRHPDGSNRAATNSTKVQGNPNTLANTAVTPSHLSCIKNYNRVHSV